MLLLSAETFFFFLLDSGLSSGLLSTRQHDYHNDLTISTSFTVDSSIIEEFW